MKKLRWLLAIAAVFAVWLRFDSIGYGLPHTYNADEPHIVNLAVSFGSGSLNPYSFKYPTLWPALLFVCYGAYFVVWSVFGLRHGVADYAGLFAWDPTCFYLIGRVLSAVFGLLGMAVIWKMERENAPEASGPPWAALVIAFCPLMVELSHAAKPDLAMFFFASLGWYFALKVYREGTRRWHWACGAALGLAMSTQYTALAASLLLPLAHALGRKAAPRPWRFLAEGVAAAGVGFFIGSPYILLDFPRFWAAMRDFSALAEVRDKTVAQVALAVHRNLWNFAGEGSIAGLAAIVGLGSFWGRDRRLAVLVLAPILAYSISLSGHPDGPWMRYLLGCFPGLALLAGESLGAVARLGRGPAVLVFLAACGPGLFASSSFDAGLGLQDTRTLAAAWVTRNIPPGTGVLMDYPHASPRLVMDKEQAAELEAKTKAAGSPRWRLYAAMRNSHPGGGYRIYRLQRSAADLRSNPAHVLSSQADAATLDMSAGLGGARRAGVGYVVTSSYGASPARSPYLEAFFEELWRRAVLVREFAPVQGKIGGPHLRIFKLSG
ncbi:MAG: glycosyltransferase family 39 protein [Elusimicrobia bacterium]|nr:glycosyltransferase family 39 protein [Elusimicrobiota bacterium]